MRRSTPRSSYGARVIESVRPSTPCRASTHTEGSSRAERYAAFPSALEALVDDLDRLGFDPVVAESDTPDNAIVAFANCPFAAFAERHPDLVCGLHHGLVAGFLDTMGDAEVAEFCSLVHRTPCQVELTSR